MTILQRCFPSFPNGLPGIALLALRTAVGVAVLVQGQFYLRVSGGTPAQDAVGFAEVVFGALLLIGFLTPVAAVGAALVALAIRLSVLPLSNPALFGSNMVLGLGTSILFASVVLGPGAFSVDARVFGRREVIIPPRTRVT